VFASSVAVFSQPEATDQTAPRPASTYGMTKAIGELLVLERTRRGEVDGCVARLPTVVIRPGVPNAAASSFASGLFREPFAGIEAVVPVAASTPMVLIGTTCAVTGLAALISVPADAMAAGRVVNLPALEVTVAEMVEAAERSGRTQASIRVEPDPEVEAIVASWPARWRADRAEELGLPRDESLDAVVASYLADLDGTVA
jgi:nucleoside-diphosphate-sugar epimerase